MPRNTLNPTEVDGLNADDPGVTLLAHAVASANSREILLVCSGDIPGVGAEATRLILDIRERSRSISRAYPLTQGLSDHDLFGHCIVWPRPHLGKDFAYWCLAKGALALRPDGLLWCAARKAKGADSLIRQIDAMMGNVEVVERSRGYRLLRARRTSAFDESQAHASLDQSYVLEDEVLGGLRLHSSPGVFSRRELDAGTRQLIHHIQATELAPSVVLDLGCGVGPLALWAATQYPHSRVLAIDSNLRAVALAQHNVERHRLDARVRVIACDGLPNPPSTAPDGFHGAVELALINPPTHAPPEVLGGWALELRSWLAPGGVALFVVNRPGRMHERLTQAGALVQMYPYPRYTVLDARWPRRPEP